MAQEKTKPAPKKEKPRESTGKAYESLVESLFMGEDKEPEANETETESEEEE